MLCQIVLVRYISVYSFSFEVEIVVRVVLIRRHFFWENIWYIHRKIYITSKLKIVVYCNIYLICLTSSQFCCICVVRVVPKLLFLSPSTAIENVFSPYLS